MRAFNSEKSSSTPAMCQLDTLHQADCQSKCFTATNLPLHQRCVSLTRYTKLTVNESALQRQIFLYTSNVSVWYATPSWLLMKAKETRKSKCENPRPENLTYHRQKLTHASAFARPPLLPSFADVFYGWSLILWSLQLNAWSLFVQHGTTI